jgi:histone H3/H4
MTAAAAKKEDVSPSADAKPDDDGPEDGVRARICKRRGKSRFAIPRVAFRRLVTEIVAQHRTDLRLQEAALDALQESAENLIGEHFARCSRVAELCRLDTVRAEHWNFARNEEGTLLG